MLTTRFIKSKNIKLKKKGKLHYSSKDYKNPFFDHKPKKNTSSDQNVILRIKYFAIFGTVLVIALFFYLLYSSIFRIKNVEIIGTGEMDKGEIQKISWETINDGVFVFLPKNSIIFFNEKKLNEKLNKNYFFDFLSIKKDYPDKIIIDFKEKQKSFIWIEDEKYFNADKGGFIIKEISPIDISDLSFPIIENKSKNKIENNTIKIDNAKISFSLELFEKFKNLTELKVEKFVLDDNQDVVKIKLINGPYLYFGKNLEIEKQINKLTTIKEAKLKSNFFEKEYIDLSFGDSVYYR